MFLVPTFLYAISNNLDIVLTLYMDSVTQQVLLQNKIILTSILWRIVFARKLEYHQWLALFLLNCGSTITVLREIPRSFQEALDLVSVPFTGLLLVILYCFCSAAAGVYCEWVYKRKQGTKVASAASSQSLHFSNIAM